MVKKNIIYTIRPQGNWDTNGYTTGTSWLMMFD